MTEISYNKETKEIQFRGSISSFVFYNQLFDALREHYKENGFKKIPTFSFVNVAFFDPLVVPNLIGIGLVLNKVHEKERVPLNFARIDSTKFLDDTLFFDNVGEEKIYSEEIPTIENGLLVNKNVLQKMGLFIFNFDKRYLGFYNNQTVQKSNNPEHKVHIYSNDSLQYYLKFIEPGVTQKDLDAIRTDKYNELKPRVKKHFYNILRGIENRNQVLKVLTEIICNSVLYSDSLSAVMLHSKDGITKISVSDFGVGFEYSFDLKKKKFGYAFTIFDKFSNEEQKEYRNYLYIFEALDYSKSKSNYRENLYTLLKDVVISNDGVMRIHYIDTQVVFSSKRCKTCNKNLNPTECAKCLLQNQTVETDVSPTRFAFGKLNGVHIEVELNN